ncbi:MAG: MGMT family protein [Erysipelotrichales bacterium]|nr:MGMT family protein [Erysipelotrichales bacterium]
MDEELVYLVLETVNEIPAGKVVSYGQLASLCDRPKNARQMGKILGNSAYYGDYPCHRVVHSDGSLTAHWPEQKELLQIEGVTFSKNNKVLMKNHRWQI